jgi:hypothetical protein
MAGNSDSADLIDPGARAEKPPEEQMPTDSQIQQFCEEEFTITDDSTRATKSSSLLCNAGRKRKGSMHSCEGSDQSLPNGSSLHKRPNVQRRYSKPSGKTVNREDQTCTQENGNKADDANIRVILIRPANEDAKKMLTSPEQLCLAFEAPPFKALNIADIRVNRRKGVVAVELKEFDEATINSLLQLTQLGNWPVTCTQPNRGKFTYGVIGPIDIQSDVSTLERRVDTCGTSKLVKLERLSRIVEGERVPSTSVRVVFEGHNLPKRIKIGYLSYSVRAYEFSPLQCYNCQRFGHSASGCTSKMRCLVCSGEHHYSTCTSRAPKCANCNGPYKANFPDCPRAPRRMERDGNDSSKVRAVGMHGRGSLGYQPPQANREMRVAADVHHRLNSPVGRSGSLLYSQVVCDGPGLNCPSSSSSTSVPSLAQSKVASVPADFVINLTNCLTDLFSLSLHQESPSKSRSLITAAIQKHFGATLKASNLSVPESTVVDASADCVAAISADCVAAVSADCVAVAMDEPARVDVPMSSPMPDDVCSADEELGVGFGVENFKLVSESDMSSEDVASSKEWNSVVSGRRAGRDCDSIGATPSLPKPSPVLGTGPRGRSKLPFGTGSKTQKMDRSKSRHRKKK